MGLGQIRERGVAPTDELSLPPRVVLLREKRNKDGERIGYVPLSLKRVSPKDRQRIILGARSLADDPTSNPETAIYGYCDLARFLRGTAYVICAAGNPIYDPRSAKE